MALPILAGMNTPPIMGNNPYQPNINLPPQNRYGTGGGQMPAGAQTMGAPANYGQSPYGGYTGMSETSPDGRGPDGMNTQERAQVNAWNAANPNPYADARTGEDMILAKQHEQGNPYAPGGAQFGQQYGTPPQQQPGWIPGPDPIRSTGGPQYGGTKPPGDMGQIPNLPMNLPQGNASPMGQQSQQYGLGGAEQSIRSGTMGGINLLGQGQNAAMNTLQGGQAQAQNYINQGVSALGGRGGGFGFGGGGASASAQQAQSANINQNAGQNQFQQGAAGINQFTGAGVQGQQQQLALSGAQGQDAFNNALMNNPATNWLQQQGMEGVMNQALAGGSAGGGQVLKELSRFNQGLASQDLNNQFNRAGALSNQGLQAAGQAGQLQGQAGMLAGNMAQQQGQMNQQANLQNAQLGTQASMANASNQTQAGIAAGRNQTALMQAQAGLYGQGAGLAGQFAGQGAGIQNQAGMNMANMLSGGANQVGALRYGAGQDISRQIGNTTGQLANYQNQQGSGMSDIIGQAGSNASNIFTGAGGATAQNQANLAALLANLATGSGTQASNAALQGGQTQANLALGQGQNQQQLIDNLMKAYGNSGAGNP